MCTATVAGATASCQLTATGLPASTTAYPIIATYGGDASFNGSTDTVAGALTIDQASTTVTAVSASPDSVTYGNESTVLFSATVSENIAYGRPDSTQAQVVAAARAAHAHDFIVQLDKGYDTVIGERGVSLSGGQKQRLAIARAFLLDPRILILDDATSSLDSKTERLIQEDMRRVCLGRTAFVIAHRLTTLQHAEKVVVLREGRIVEQGSPAELMAHGIFFKELFREQQADRDADKSSAGVNT